MSITNNNYLYIVLILLYIIIYNNITLYVNPIPQIPIVKLLIVNVRFSNSDWIFSADRVISSPPELGGEPEGRGGLNNGYFCAISSSERAPVQTTPNPS